MEGWMDIKAGLRIAYSNQKSLPGWKDGCKSRVKDSLQQSKKYIPGYLLQD